MKACLKLTSFAIQDCKSIPKKIATRLIQEQHFTKNLFVYAQKTNLRTKHNLTYILTNFRFQVTLTKLVDHPFISLLQGPGSSMSPSRVSPAVVVFKIYHNI